MRSTSMGGMGMDTPLCWQPTRGMWGSMIYTQRGGRAVKTHMLVNANTLLRTDSLKHIVKMSTHTYKCMHTRFFASFVLS